MTRPLDAADRDGVAALLRRYLWCMDTGNVDGVVATFTADGTILDVTGKRWDAASGGVRGFAGHFLLAPGRPASQHWLQTMAADAVDEDTCRVVSYWAALSWDSAADSRFVRLIGCYTDTCVRAGDGWLIREKVIDPWTPERVPALAGLLG